MFEDVFAALDPCTLEQLKELSSKRHVIEETINDASSITEAVAREMYGGLISQSEQVFCIVLRKFISCLLHLKLL